MGYRFIETSAMMYTINSIVALIVAGGIVTYLVQGTVREMYRDWKFNKQWKARINK